MPHRVEANPEVIGAVVVAGLGGLIAAVLIPGADHQYLKAGMMLSSALGLTAGVFGVYCARKRLSPTAPAVVNREGPSERREAEANRDAWPRVGATALRQDLDASPMELRMTGSLKSIMARAEQGLVASDAEKASHLAAIWSMAACDLEDDPDQVAH